jgi:hypothetical protein
MIATFDVPFEAIREAYNRAIKKKGTCRVIPQSRFYVQVDGNTVFNGLVCCTQEMGGQSTGVAASVCRNCKLTKKERNKR